MHEIITNCVLCARIQSELNLSHSRILATSHSLVMSFSLLACDDLHLHVRDGAALRDTVRAAAESSARALIMPNLQPPVVNTQQAEAYRSRILHHLTPEQQQRFTPLMSLYLTEQTTVADIEAAAASPHVYAVKLYPSGATTHSTQGVRLDAAKGLTALYPVFECMARHSMPLLIHSEVTDPTVDVFDRECVFIEQFARRLIADQPHLKIVLEHITTRQAVDFVQSCGPNVGATVTAHHLLVNRNKLFEGGINAHYYCLPLLKAEEHRLALCEAVMSPANTRIFAGSDSAPHAINDKEKRCGCAGCFTGHATLELYAQAFSQQGKLDTKEQQQTFERFTSRNGAQFYGLTLNTQQVTLLRQEWTVPEQVQFGESVVRPFAAGQTLQYRLEHRSPATGAAS